jgi:hypothetical protein
MFGSSERIRTSTDFLLREAPPTNWATEPQNYSSSMRSNSSANASAGLDNILSSSLSPIPIKFSAALIGAFTTRTADANIDPNIIIINWSQRRVLTSLIKPYESPILTEGTAIFQNRVVIILKQ